VTEAQEIAALATVQEIRDFIAVYDPSDAFDRQYAAQIRQRLNSELYRRERDRYPEWIDLGGES
jgi:hypothetical protein